MLNPDREQVTTYSYILAGFVCVIGLFRLMSYTSLGISDGLFLVIAGLILFAVARMLGDARVYALYFSGVVAVASLWYSLQMRSFGVLLLAALGILWSTWLYGFRKNGELK